MTSVRLTFLVCLLPLLYAGAPAAAQTPRETTSGLALDSAERFEPFGDNFLIYNTMRNNGWARRDEWALRAHFSLKYTLCGPQLVRRGVPFKDTTRSGATFCPKGETIEKIEFFYSLVILSFKILHCCGYD